MNIFSSPSGTQMYDEQSFYRAFQKDLYSARKSVIIESPFITLRRIEELLPVITKLRRKGVSVTVNTRNPIEHDEEYEMQALVAIEQLQGLGVKVWAPPNAITPSATPCRSLPIGRDSLGETRAGFTSPMYPPRP